MFQITSYRSLLKYFFFSPKFFWGIILDMFVLPLALLMFIIKWCYKKDLDNLFSHPKHLPPILLVHGSGANEAQWLITRLYLRSKFNVYSVQLNTLPMPSTSDSIEDYEPIIAQKVQSIYDECQQKVTLVGHSMGGLAVCYYAEHHKDALKYVKQIITIASPFQGAPALDFVKMGTKRHHQMSPHSVFLTKLHNLLNNSIHDYTCFGSHYDFQVPHPYTHISKPNITSITYPWGHTSAILFPTIWQYIK